MKPVLTLSDIGLLIAFTALLFVALYGFLKGWCL